MIIPAAHAAVTEAWDQLGAWGLRVREAVAFLGPIPPRCGPSPSPRAAGSRESLQRAGGFLWGLAPSPEYFTAGFYGILACILFCFVLVSELLAGTAVFSLWDIFLETALLPSFPAVSHLSPSGATSAGHCPSRDPGPRLEVVGSPGWLTGAPVPSLGAFPKPRFLPP